MIFDIDIELADEDTMSIKPCITMLLAVGFFALFYKLVGTKMGPEL